MTEGTIHSINISTRKGEKKKPVKSARLIRQKGIKNDAHFGSEIKQVSLLPLESIEAFRTEDIHLQPGDFAENITTEGLNTANIPVGIKMRLGKDIVIKISRIGKECHDRCEIYDALGDCIMPKEGIFAKVLQGGILKKGDPIKIKEEI